MIIRDEQRQRKERVEQGLAANADRLIKMLQEEAKYADLVTDLPTTVEKAGNWMSHLKLEEKLKRLVPNATFHPHPTKPDIRYMRPNPNLPDEYIIYSTPSPERSIRSIIRRTRIKPGILGNPNIQVSRDDLPKYEVTKPIFRPDGSIAKLGDILWEENSLPAGMEYIDEPGGELMRGWRTVLVYLIGARYITVDEAEREFGAANTREWAKHTGKRGSLEIPW